jgi:hypothetical protein
MAPALIRRCNFDLKMKGFERNQARPAGHPAMRTVCPRGAGVPVSDPVRWGSLWLIGILLLALGAKTQAADTNSPPLSPQDYFEGGPNTYNNWITLSTGGLLTRGNQAQAAESLHWGTGPFGGIEDLHLQGNALLTNTTFTLDGHSIFDDHDYQLSLKLAHPDRWFLRFNFENFRTWYNAAGGFYPLTGMEYSSSSDALALDRGEFSFEGGLTLEKLPAITFKYSHRYRDGEKSSTIWGPVHPDLFTDPTLVQGLAPSFYDIDEKIDTFELDLKQHVKETDLALGLRFETADLNNALYTTRYQGEGPPAEQKTTDREKTTYDLFSLNASSETWIKKNLRFSSGFMFANLDNDFSGNRIYGNDFNVSYAPSASSGYGYTNLLGNSHLQEYVMDLNLMSIPIKTVTIVPSLRVQKESWDANSSGGGTLGAFPPDSFNSQSSRDVIDVCESLDTRYTGVTNWVFSARGDWEEGQGSLTQSGGLSQVSGFGTPPLPQSETDDGRFFQKYSVGARWYPLRRLTIDVGGYYKNNKYDYSNPPNTASNDFSMQSFQTYDGNVRLTLRPIQNVTLVGRYEYQLSTVNTQPDPASGLGGVEASKMTSHILAGDVSWTPWSRLSLQAGLDYVLSETKTPATDFTQQAILNSQNNYWTVNFSSDFVVDDKTDLNLGYFYYQADDYQDNSNAGLAVGAGAREHGVTATLTRRITQNLRASLKYGYYNYADAASGGFNNFEAHLIFASMQYRF